MTPPQKTDLTTPARAQALQLAQHVWPLRDLSVSLSELWRGEPRWRLTCDVLSRDGAADLTITGHLELRCARPVGPEDLRGATWTVDEMNLGTYRELVVDERRVTPGCGEEALAVRVELSSREDPPRAELALTITGSCELYLERVDDLEDYTRADAAFALHGLAALQSMFTDIAGPAPVWPEGHGDPDVGRVRHLANIRARCLAAWPLAQVSCYEYETKSEGSSNGVVTTLAAAERPDDRWESLARLLCRGALLFGPTAAPARIWSDEVERELAAALLRRDESRASLERASARVERVRRILLLEFGRERPNPALVLTLNGARRTDDAAHAVPWPVTGELREAITLRDEWNDQLLFVRTDELDALLSWGTGA